MKSIFAVVGACLGLATYATGAGAKPAEVVFHGSFVVTAADHCTVHHVNDEAKAAYHPRIPGNGNFEGLSVINSYGGADYYLPKANLTRAFKLVKVLALGSGGAYKWLGARVAVNLRSPTNINATTRQVLLSGQITAPDGDPGDGRACAITFEASFVR